MLDGMKLKAIGFLLLCSLLASCNLAANAAASRFSLGLEPDSVTVAPGESAKVKVTVRPLTGFEFKPGATTVSLYEPPAGVTAEAITIPSGLDGTLTLEVAESVALTPEDEPLELELRADKEGIGAKKTLELSVAPTDEVDEN